MTVTRKFKRPPPLKQDFETGILQVQNPLRAKGKSQDLPSYPVFCCQNDQQALVPGIMIGIQISVEVNLQDVLSRCLSMQFEYLGFLKVYKLLPIFNVLPMYSRNKNSSCKLV